MIGTVLILLICVVWETLVWLSPEHRFLLSSPLEVLQLFPDFVEQSSVWQDFAFTGSAVVTALILGSALGTGVGLALTLFPSVRRSTQRFMLVLGTIPILALAPVIVLWVGIGWQAKVAIAMLGTFAMSIQLSSAGAAATMERFEEYLIPLDLSAWRLTRQVLLPGALAWVIHGYRANISAAILGVFIGEYLNSSFGLGHRIMRSGSLYRIAEVWCGVLLLVALGLMLSVGGNIVLRRCFPGAARAAAAK